MRVLLVALYGSVKGGTEAYLGALARGLGDTGHSAALAYRYDPDPSREDVRAGRLLEAISSRSPEPSAVDARAVEQLLADVQPDLVHVHNVDAPWMPRFFAERVPTLYAVHDHRVDCPVGTRYWAAWHRACGIVPGPVCLAYNVVAHCGSLRANATLKPYANWRRTRAAAAGVPHIQVFSAYMAGMLERSGVDPGRVAVTPYPVPPAAEPTDVPAGVWPVIFATGRLVKEKGFDTLIASLDYLDRPVELVIAGQGHHEHALRAEASRVQKRHRITFAGWLDPGELSGWYRRADIVAVPSAWPEPFGIVGLEAMSWAKPVVATKIGGITEWLVDGVTGVAVPPGDARAFGAAFADLLQDEGKRTRMGSAARQRTQDEFSLAEHVRRLSGVYEAVMR
jgi:glycosyltransferase involved in cell wall biosynthesis